MWGQPNRLRAKLKGGAIATGSMVFSWSPNVVEAAGSSGVDFVRIDAEHAWRQDAMLEHLARAAAAVGVVLMVRIDRENPQLVRKALEIGAGAVLVANVRSVEEAEDVARAAKFPPRGVRGFSGYCRSAGWNAMPAADWVRWSDSEPMIGIMIEDVAAMASIDEIMAVDGVDFANFGPADFSFSLGLPAPARRDPRVEGALKRTVEAARRCAKHVMCNVPAAADEIARHVAMGLTILELGNDLDAVRLTLKEAMKAVPAPAFAPGTKGPN
jgi:4-hydroxy-2-oxoheptanedioate aldolase